MAVGGKRVLVSGAGIAGPAVAHWLGRAGAEVTVVEAACAVRAGGAAVDFRGPTHLAVLERMGVLGAVQDLATHGGAMSFVDADDREVFRLPAEFAGGDVEVRRGDLAGLLVERAPADYRFGTSVRSLRQGADGVVADLGAGPERFDLVIGADGVHSGVRRLAFGPERGFVRHLGHHIATWSLPNTFGPCPASRYHCSPGRTAAISVDPRTPDRATAMALFISPPTTRDPRELIVDRLSGMGWHTPALLAGLPTADDLFADSLTRVRVPRWSHGRVVLLGDAAWGVTLGGMGTGTALVGAHVLAGELATGDWPQALKAYEDRIRRYAAVWQRGANPGRFLAPRTAWGLRARDALMSSAVVQRWMVSSTQKLAQTPALPDYAWEPVRG
ncbi:FAD-dependent monooxygenase [Actinokineospora bangkokensis]|uniref:FAD-dependent oxidoreductase n=1 Tax=Actinokineospora bangkokensis TaxID=1193682 RepID=A0A1Q9LH08_9PSEU|nr:FAD-dependent monooxygenase [Actinokineospora bangkokensis]OLR91331.1 FAD-dependent oxidoreductase [Actinokineospora bangkokensis]